ncbi:hypothetical protein C8R45DRAFT_1076964, partial [Mycena sanguinolenta]
AAAFSVRPETSKTIHNFVLDSNQCPGSLIQLILNSVGAIDAKTLSFCAQGTARHFQSCPRRPLDGIAVLKCCSSFSNTCNLTNHVHGSHEPERTYNVLQSRSRARAILISLPLDRSPLVENRIVHPWVFSRGISTRLDSTRAQFILRPPCHAIPSHPSTRNSRRSGRTPRGTPIHDGTPVACEHTKAYVLTPRSTRVLGRWQTRYSLVKSIRQGGLEHLDNWKQGGHGSKVLCTLHLVRYTPRPSTTPYTSHSHAISDQP